MGPTERSFTRQQSWLAICKVFTSPQSRLEGVYAERLIGSICRESLDHMIVQDETEVRHILKSYFDYYESSRARLSLGKDAPLERTIDPL